jgi:hypothetical protein
MVLPWVLLEYSCVYLVRTLLLGTRSLGSNFDLISTAVLDLVHDCISQSAVLAQGVWCTRQPSQADAWLTVSLGELR